MQKNEQHTLWIHDLIREILAVPSEEERLALFQKFRAEHPDEAEALILQDMDELSGILMQLKNSSVSHELSALTDSERAELEETVRIIDENQFDYHFQPIVNTTDGGIFSYEALMRPRSKMNLSPFHILKYARLMKRLQDIERQTFLNVLGIINERKQDFGGRFVFINSMPEAKLSPEDFRRITEMLLKHSDTAVVEMTEQSEIDDESLSTLKERYQNIGIQTAIDDYGSGYSNASNLLRYMPNFVKIDRSLLNEIQESPKKRHFVREIIRFCHDNDILALAEGVETAEELHTVILLGADLIQGFFTARPTAEIIPSIPEDIRQMIRRFRQERENGIGQQIYIADSTERIMLDRMVQAGVKCIVIGENGSGNVTIEGDPNLDSQIRIETRKGYAGKLALNNAWLNGIKNKPCVDIGEENDLTLVLTGENKLDMGGIRVPVSSRLTTSGKGRLEINVDDTEFYGIGNRFGALHGELNFEHSGRITINGRGQTGVAIGSGTGGRIKISAGQYRLNLHGDVVVGIGSLYADNEMLIHDCDIGMEITAARGTAIGSIGQNNDIRIYKTSAKIFMSGVELTGIGTLDGETAKLSVREASCFIQIKGERCAAFASLEGQTDVTIEQACIRLTVNGKQALGIGGFSGDTMIAHKIADIHIILNTQINVEEAYIPRTKIGSSDGKYVLTLNGRDVIDRF